MQTIQAISPAKLNLTFDIKGLMSDGYHEVETLLQSVDLQDELVFTLSPADQLNVEISLDGGGSSEFPLNDTNLIAKAAKLFVQESGVKPFGLHVAVTKFIPIGAGLAGGSANGAATLVALNYAFDSPFGPQDLLSLGSRLGADVPFCIQGGTAIGTGRGDILQAIACDTTLFFCIVKPRKLSVSTPWAYGIYDEFTGKVKRPHLQNAANSMCKADLDQAVKSFGNVFEPPIFEKMPELIDLQKSLIELGCWYCQLSGSGPALFAIVPDREMAHYVRRKVLHNDDSGFDYFSAQPTAEFGPPFEFHIAQSVSHGARVVDASAR